MASAASPKVIGIFSDGWKVHTSYLPQPPKPVVVYFQAGILFLVYNLLAWKCGGVQKWQIWGMERSLVGKRFKYLWNLLLKKSSDFICWWKRSQVFWSSVWRKCEPSPFLPPYPSCLYGAAAILWWKLYLNSKLIWSHSAFGSKYVHRLIAHFFTCKKCYISLQNRKSFARPNLYELTFFLLS